MPNLLVASGNEHKRREFSELLSQDLFSLSTPSQTIPVVEDGETFFANAAKKAEAYFLHFRHPVVSDDSGLDVDALPGELGIRSARFGSEDIDDRMRAELLVKRMEGISERGARFVCVLCFYLNADEIFFFEGRMEGSIAKAYTGTYGFGYDPVFIPKKHGGQKTLAEIPDWKKAHSHRAIACRKASSFFLNSKAGNPIPSMTENSPP